MDINFTESTSIRILISLGLFILSVPVYFQLARKFNWLDIPNQRSSHQRPTYRGFGILFLNGLWLFPPDHYWLAGALIIAAVTGFIDDIRPLKAWVRAFLYGLALFLAIFNIEEIHQLNIVILMMAIIIGLGTINAVNFMDGINGISVFYALVYLLSIYGAVLLNILPSENLELWLPLTAILLVFSYLNVRKKALVFMGDAGSVFLGLMMVYGIIHLCISTGTLLWTGLLMLYGVDTIVTIVERILRKENIFEAHRTHLYQLLSNELNIPHVKVSLVYAILQILINIILFVVFQVSDWPDLLLFILILICGFIYLFVKKGIRKNILSKSLSIGK